MKRHYHMQEPSMAFVAIFTRENREINFLTQVRRLLLEAISFEYDLDREAEFIEATYRGDKLVGVYVKISFRLDYMDAIKALADAGFIEWPKELPLPFV